MATYTHNATAVPGDVRWYTVAINNDNPASASTTLFVLTNSDGTETRIIGTGFTYDTNGNPTGGTISQIDRADTGGSTVYETITGLSLSLVSLNTALDSGTGAAFALIFANADTFHGFVGEDHFNGGAGADVLDGGAGFDFA
jgi:Ca2+-binding RTX toxin-like protein